ncbi:hypothetical protein, partial [Salmonella sp. s54395]|uniref:hypothetical protein n=1 Tax=Salmonella sp. s54395 TaxID=3159664 RepID=UPI00397E989B
FNLPNHSIDCLKFAIIKGNLTDFNKRTLLETQLILRLSSHIYGPNKDPALLTGLQLAKR